MNDKELLKYDIKHLIKAYNCIHTAMDYLKDINEFDEIEYEDLNTIAENINDLRIKKENEFERKVELYGN